MFFDVHPRIKIDEAILILYEIFFIQQVAQTLDDVLMGISNFFVFVFRQTYAFLASQFSCFIETWATNKGAG